MFKRKILLNKMHTCNSMYYNKLQNQFKRILKEKFF